MDSTASPANRVGDVAASAGPIAAVIDPPMPATQFQDVTGIARSVPVADRLLHSPGRPRVAVGLAPSGGVLPEAMRAMCWRHSRPGCPSPAWSSHLADDDLALHAAAAWRWIRSSPGTRHRQVRARCRLVLPARARCCTDTAVGKMSACLAGRRRSAPARPQPLGTGQAGIPISGTVSLDAVRVD